MPLVNISDNLLHTNGILEKLISTQAKLDKLPNAIQSESASRKIKTIKDNLKKIYFEGMDDDAIKASLSASIGPFNPSYLSLQQTLEIVFANENNLDAMIAQISALPSEDWAPNESTLLNNYQRLERQYGYFEATDKGEELQSLFEKLVPACRKIIVLSEKNNTSDDTMAYDYAYKLMAMLVDDTKPVPSLKELSTKINNLLASNDKSNLSHSKPFHDVLLDLKLPKKEHDRAGWIALIDKEGAKILPYYTMADKLDEKKGHKAPKTLNEAKTLAASCRYSRASEDEAFARLCYDYKTPEETFNAGLDFIGKPPMWPKKQTDTLPDVKIESSDSNYAWVKLPIHDKRGLILGKITDCCQSIGDHSSQCVQDAASLSDNSLYVLLKRKRNTASSCITSDGSVNYDDFQIIGQSYAWRSQAGNLSLDSIECLSNSITTEQLKDILSAFAEKVLETTPTIKRITLGTGGKTPLDLFPMQTSILEAMRQGHFYGDARNQYLIAKQPNQLTEEQIQILTSRYQATFRDRLLYLAEHLDDTTNFPEQIADLLRQNPSLSTTFSVNSLFKLLRFTPNPTLNDLKPIDWSQTLPPGLSTGHLISQADTLDKIIIALAYIPTQDRLAVVKEKDQFGCTVLHDAIGNPESLKLILERLPEPDRLDAVKEKDQFGHTVLHLVARSPESLRLILDLYPESDRLVAVKEKDRFGDTVLLIATMKPKVFKVILEQLPESDRLAAVKEKNQDGDTVLHIATRKPKAFKVILERLPESDRLAAVKEKDQFDNTVLYRAAENPELLRLTLDLYPESDRLAAVKEKNQFDNTVLYRAALNPEVLKVILEMVDVAQLLHSDAHILNDHFEIVRDIVVAKAAKLAYTPEQILAIQNTSSCSSMEKTLNKISQVMIKTQILQMGSSQEEPTKSNKLSY